MDYKLLEEEIKKRVENLEKELEKLKKFPSEHTIKIVLKQE